MERHASLSLVFPAPVRGAFAARYVNTLAVHPARLPRVASMSFMRNAHVRSAGGVRSRRSVPLHT